MTTNGKAIAMTVAGLLLAAVPQLAHAEEKKDGKVRCAGINACKGKGACSTATNGCGSWQRASASGQRSAKMQPAGGWVRSGRRPGIGIKGTRRVPPRGSEPIRPRV